LDHPLDSWPLCPFLQTEDRWGWGRFAVSTFNLLAFARAPAIARDGLNPVAVIHATRLGCTEEYRRHTVGVLHGIGLELYRQSISPDGFFIPA
jgi:hypothetical protein